MHRVGGHPIPYSTILYTTTNHAIPTNDTKAYYHTICHAKSWKSFLPYSTIVYTTKNHTSAHNKTSPWYSIQFSMTQDTGWSLQTFSTTNIQWNQHLVQRSFSMTQDRRWSLQTSSALIAISTRRLYWKSHLPSPASEMVEIWREETYVLGLFLKMVRLCQGPV